MPMRKSKSAKKIIGRVLPIKPPKGFFVDDTDTDIVGFRRKGKPKVGVTFTRIPKAPKFKGKTKMKKKPRRKRKS